VLCKSTVYFTFTLHISNALLLYFVKHYRQKISKNINWTESELSNLIFTLNSAIRKIYKAKFQLLDRIYKYTDQIDIVHVIKHE